MDDRKGRDFSRNLALKEDYAFMAADGAGGIDGGEHGFYHRDTRFLSQYRWDFGNAVVLMAETPRPDMLLAYYGELEGHAQLLGVERRLELHATGFRDRLQVENSGVQQREVTLDVRLGADFADLFEVRGWGAAERTPVHPEWSGSAASWRYTARDGVGLATHLTLSPAPTATRAGGAAYRLVLEPGESAEITAEIEVETPLEAPAAGIGYEVWRSRFVPLVARSGAPEVLHRSIDDLRALLLFTGDGPIVAAGIPWFVAAFGRDGLLTAHMLLEHAPDVAEGTLRYLASYQGMDHRALRVEQPGKIMHELRFGEMSRTGEVPFGPYYGSVDATPLWVMLLHAHAQRTGTHALAEELRANLDAAVHWMVQHGDHDGDRFLEFVSGGHERGLTVQSWKDSPDSMSHADGSLAEGALAVAEVQGYAFAAYEGAASIYRALGDDAAADRWHEHARALRHAFQASFWSDDLGTYAMALDGAKRPLRVHSSGAGQLLWTGIVPEDTAGELARTLFRDENFTGWGIRTLGSNEVRYHPMSYHNGSVWPHDTALIAGGLARYGFLPEAATLRRALFDLAASQRDLRPPELVAGYRREHIDDVFGGRSVPPVPYPVACRPQAWDAAALIYLASLDL